MSAWCFAGADDIAISRTGKVLRCKVDSVSEDAVWLMPRFDNLLLNVAVKNIDIKPERFRVNDIYMISLDDGRSVFFHPKGVRDTVQATKRDKTADRIYLAEGREVQGWDSKVSEGEVSYYKSNPKKKGYHSQMSIPLPEVFMIIHNDGSTEVIQELDFADCDMEDIDYESLEKEREIKLRSMTFTLPEAMTVIDVANHQGVTVENLKEWNRWPDSIKANTRLQCGSVVWISKPDARKSEIEYVEDK